MFKFIFNIFAVVGFYFIVSFLFSSEYVVYGKSYQLTSISTAILLGAVIEMIRQAIEIKITSK